MAIFFRAVVTAFLVLTMNSLARLPNQDLHPDNNTLVAKLEGYYAVIDSLKIGDIGSRIKIQQKSISTDYLPTNDPECNGYWVTVDDQPVMPYVAWALGNKFFSSMSERQLSDTPIYRAYLRMFQKSNNNRIVDMSQLYDPGYKQRVQDECSKAEKLSSLYKQLETERDGFWRDYVKGNYSASKQTTSPHAPTPMPVAAAPTTTVKTINQSNANRTVGDPAAIWASNFPCSKVKRIKLTRYAQVTTNKIKHPFAHHDWSKPLDIDTNGATDTVVFVLTDTHASEPSNIINCLKQSVSKSKAKNVIIAFNGDYSVDKDTMNDYSKFQGLIDMGNGFVNSNGDKVDIQTLFGFGNHDTSNLNFMKKMIEDVNKSKKSYIISDIFGGYVSCDPFYLPAIYQNGINTTRCSNRFVGNNVGIFFCYPWIPVMGFGANQCDAGYDDQCANSVSKSARPFWNPDYCLFVCRLMSDPYYSTISGKNYQGGLPKVVLGRDKNHLSYKEEANRSRFLHQNNAFGEDDARFHDGQPNPVAVGRCRQLYQIIYDASYSLHHNNPPIIIVPTHGSCADFLYEMREASAIIKKINKLSWLVSSSILSRTTIIVVGGHLHNDPDWSNKNYGFTVTSHAPCYSGSVPLYADDGSQVNVLFYAKDLTAGGMKGQGDEVLEIHLTKA